MVGMQTNQKVELSLVLETIRQKCGTPNAPTRSTTMIMINEERKLDEKGRALYERSSAFHDDRFQFSLAKSSRILPEYRSCPVPGTLTAESMKV